MNNRRKEVLEEQKKYYKMRLTPIMSLEEKMGELWSLPEEDLSLLLELCTADEDEELRQTIKAVLFAKNVNKLLD